MELFLLCFFAVFSFHEIVKSEEYLQEARNSQNAQILASLSHMRNELYIANQRLSAVVETFNKKINDMDEDKEDTKASFQQLQSDVMKLQTTVAPLTPLLEQMQHLQSLVSGFDIKINSAQKTTAEDIRLLQSEYNQNYNQLKEQYSQQQIQLSNQDETITKLSNKLADVNAKLTDQNKAMSNIKQRLDAAEDKIDVDPPYDVTVQRVHSSMNLLQDEVVNAYRKSRDEVTHLQSQLDAIKEQLKKYPAERR